MFWSVNVFTGWAFETCTVVGYTWHLLDCCISLVGQSSLPSLPHKHFLLAQSF